MIEKVVPYFLLWTMTAGADNKFFRPTIEPYNVTRTTPIGIAAYRSALTLDWLAAEDNRQRELVSAFESQPMLSNKLINGDCIQYPRPSAGTIARLMLEMLKNLEGDSDIRSIIHELLQSLIRAKLLKLESLVYENEPDLDALMKTPIELAGEPHVTLPRLIAIAWMAITDPATVKKHGWCTINRISKYVNFARPSDIAKHMRAAEPIISRARYIMEEFIHHLTPLNLMKSSSSSVATTRKFRAIIGRPRSKYAPTVKTTISRTRNEYTPIAKTRPTRGLRLTSVLQQLVLSNVTPSALNLVRLKTTVTNELMDYDVMYGGDDVSVKFKIIYLLLPVLLWPCACQDADILGIGNVGPDLSIDNQEWHYKSTSKRPAEELEKVCFDIHPTARDIVKRFYAILPYFDKEHANKAFLHKFRGTVNVMSQTEDLLDREAAFYATVLTPIIFLQSYRHTWCLLERVRSFILDMPGSWASTKRTTSINSDFDDEEIRDKKDIRYLKELIRNLG
ncbi:uncharacterized protein LOC113237999 [Hyposmocoma kahamanoa]|uniref:uncharacterized protein LOC113237999 n=1 Tax=Hyposmocoma kahamanoa TaxID=1477025 RepID=UPI000E6D804E|nr:uncharacterized protein LOC113237999 [Hyposmocoma kahamanoa]